MNPPTIVPRVTSDTVSGWQLFTTFLDARNSLSVQFPVASMIVIDLSQAMRRGQTCTRYAVQCESDRDYCCVNFVHHYGSLATLWKLLDGHRWETGRYGGYKSQSFRWCDEQFVIHRSDRKANRTFSLLHLDRLKPLTKRPTKWTKLHAVRAIVNGQYDDIRVDGRYTDDYAHDAAVKFGRGQIKRPIEFARRIYEGPNGWRVYDDGGRVQVNCHSFDTNSFSFNLEARTGQVEAAS